MKNRKLELDIIVDILSKIKEDDFYFKSYSKDIIKSYIDQEREKILDFLYNEICERRDYSASKMCEKVIEFINTLNLSYQVNNKTIISPYELDIWFPDKNIAIEVDGIYWHSSEKSLERDGVKDNLCKDIGITLLRFTDIEIDRDFEVVKNKIVGIFL